MKVHYRRTIRERLDEAIAEAKKESRGIAWIELDEGEWAELQSDWFEENGKTVWRGIEVRRKVEPADEVEVGPVWTFTVTEVYSQYISPFSPEVSCRATGSNNTIRWTQMGVGDGPKVKPGDVLEVRVK